MKKHTLLFLLLTFNACQIGTPPEDPAVVKFEFSSATITEGEEVTLSWETVGGDSVTLLPDGVTIEDGEVSPEEAADMPGIDEMGEVDASGEITFAPTETTTYIITVTPAINTGLDTATSEVTVTVNPPASVSPTDPTNPTDPTDPTSPVDPVCNSTLTTDDLKLAMDLSVSSMSIYLGESVTVTWDVSSSDTTISVKQDDTEVSSDISGSITIIPTETTTIKLDASTCSTSNSISKTITVKQPSQKDISNISSVFINSMGTKLWAGTSSGQLYFSEDSGDTFSLISDSSRIDEATCGVSDNTAITSILYMSNGCRGTVFFGTAGGYVYRSTDGGVTISDLSGRACPLFYLYANVPSGADIEDYPSVINSIVQSPSDKDQVFVGHDSGLITILDCATTSTDDLKWVNGDFGSNVDFEGPAISAAVSYNDQLYVTDGSYLYSSADGLTWSTALSDSINWLSTSNQKLLVGTSDTIKTYDGSDWEEISASSTTGGTTSNSMIVSGNDNGLSVSRDDSESWVSIDGFDEGVRKIISVGSLFNQSFWVLTTEGNLYRFGSGISFLSLPIMTYRPVTF